MAFKDGPFQKKTRTVGKPLRGCAVNLYCSPELMDGWMDGCYQEGKAGRPGTACT